MKICFVCNEYPPAPHGGIGTFVRTLGTFLARQRHDVVVVGFGGSGTPKAIWNDDGVEVTPLKTPARWLTCAGSTGYVRVLSTMIQRVVLSKTVRRLCTDRGVDVVESYDWSGPLWDRPSSPLLVRMHGANTAYCVYERRRPSSQLRYFERKNLAIADRLVAVSEHIGALTVRSVGLPNRPYRVIYNAVDTTVFRPCGRSCDPNEVLFVGRVSRRKGLEELFSAIPLVLAQRPGTRFSIAGPISKNQQGESLDAHLMAELPAGCRSSIQFLGRTPHRELPWLYNRAAVCVFPSLAEAFGLTCVEAMACGRPVVMTNEASGPEIVEDGISGLLADPRDPLQLSACLLRLLGSPELRQTIGEAARHRTEAKFALKNLADATLEEYTSLLSRHS